MVSESDILFQTEFGNLVIGRIPDNIVRNRGDVNLITRFADTFEFKVNIGA